MEISFFHIFFLVIPSSFPFPQHDSQPKFKETRQYEWEMFTMKEKISCTAQAQSLSASFSNDSMVKKELRQPDRDNPHSSLCHPHSKGKRPCLNKTWSRDRHPLWGQPGKDLADSTQQTKHNTVPPAYKVLAETCAEPTKGFQQLVHSAWSALAKLHFLTQSNRTQPA